MFKIESGAQLPSISFALLIHIAVTHRFAASLPKIPALLVWNVLTLTRATIPHSAKLSEPCVVNPAVCYNIT